MLREEIELMKQRAIITFILLMAFFSPALSLAADVVIVANENVPAASLAAKDVKQIFLGNKTSWDNGDKIVFVVQDRTDAADVFLKAYVKKSASQYDNYWKKQVFTGKGKAPQSFSSDQELVKFVSETPGAIGYVSSGATTENTKTISVQ
jgi:ABC-type phosphate transport system substrate-binding protein